MAIISDVFNLDTIKEYNNDIYLCLGFFDGLHLGHQELIKKALKESNNVGVLTFNVSPAYVLGKQPSDRVLTSPQDKLEILEKMGVKYFFVFEIDKEVLNMDETQFICSVLMSFNPKKVFCGEDFTFGRDASGNPNTLKSFFNVEVIPFKKIDNQKISSRVIKEAISLGMIEYANKLLGRYYTLFGLVVEGRQIGRRIGYPTANIQLDYQYVLPQEGVYACYVSIGDRKEKGLLSFSRQPTFRSTEDAVLEIHLLDFNEDIYGRLVSIEMISYLRPISHFDNVEELKKQIEIDKQNAEKYFK